MVYMALLGLFVALVGIILIIFKKYGEGSLTFVVGGVIFALSIVIAGLTTVSSGHVGVQTLFGRVYEKNLPAGIHVVNPFCAVHEMSVRTENYVMSATHHEGQVEGDDSVEAMSSNGLAIAVDASIPYKLREEQAAWVFQNFGENYVDKLLRQAARTAVRRAISRYTDEECYSTKREQMAHDIKTCFDEEMAGILKQYGVNAPDRVVEVSQVLIGRISLPDKVKDAIGEKLKANQEALAMKFRITKEQLEADRKKIEAEGIQKFQEIVSKGIDERLLKWKGIEITKELAASPNAKIIVIGNGKDGLPIILSGENK